MKNKNIPIALKKYYLTHSSLFRNRISKRCLICHKKFEVFLAFKKQKFCSFKCYGKSLRRRIPYNKGIKMNYTADALRWMSRKGKKMSMSAKEKIKEYQILHPNRCFKDTSIEIAIENELKNRGLKMLKVV